MPCLDSFSARRILPVPLIKNQAGVENENITAVQAGAGSRNFGNPNVVNETFEVKETRNKLLRLHVVETRINPTGQDLDRSFEQGEEISTFVALNFAMLDWGTTEVIIELHGFIGSRT